MKAIIAVVIEGSPPDEARSACDHGFCVHIHLAENVAVLAGGESVRSNNESRFLMCPPHHFGVEYVINPWMQGQINAADQELASRQWMQLHGIMSNYADVALMPAVSGLPDLVFTANAALVYGHTAVLSSFRCTERQPEARYYAEWLSADGFRVNTLPSGTVFEGAGDALFDRGIKALLWYGYGYRSNPDAVPHLQESIDVEVEALRLCDPRLYHLDTCFCPLEGAISSTTPQHSTGKETLNRNSCSA
jgi:N-dimethylarginine dimethylaminohydrolase